METDRFYLELALEEAEQAGRDGTYPIGALIVGPDGIILSRGRNRVYSVGDYTAHAEVDALRTEVTLNRFICVPCTRCSVQECTAVSGE